MLAFCARLVVIGGCFVGGAAETQGEANSMDRSRPAALIGTQAPRVAVYARMTPLDLPYLEAWAEHYRSLGFNRIYLIQTGLSQKTKQPFLQ
eukprot:scaffold288254_cov44-Prasinocladus_malaysianus.AAC.1